jgi:predicted esterase
MTRLLRRTFAHSPVAWLVACAVFVAAATPVLALDDDPPDFRKLNQELYAKYQAGEYTEALELAEEMHKLQPDHINTIYNIACLHCLLGDESKAYEWLEKAVEAGFDNDEQLVNDDDFKKIRAEDRFRAIVKRIRTKKEKAAAKEEAAKQEKEQAAKKAKPEKPAEPKDADKPKKPDKPKEPAKPAAPQPVQPTRKTLLQVEMLTQELIVASQGGERYKALAIALEARVVADIGLTNYNVACMYSLLGKKDDAFRYLERSIELGGVAPDMAAQIKSDSDFDNIRDDPRYAAIIAKLKGESGETAEKEASGSEGKPVDPEWQVTLPDGFDKSEEAVLIVALHPYGGNMEMTTGRWKEAAAELGAILLTPQGAFSLSDDSYEWGAKIDPIEESVLDAVDDVLEEYKVDKDKIVITGFSQGGSVAWALAVRNPDIFCGVIPVACKLPSGLDKALEDEEVKELRVFAAVGEDDNEELVDGCRRAVKRFKQLGAQAKLRVYEGVGHGLPDNAAAEQVKAVRFVIED